MRIPLTRPDGSPAGFAALTGHPDALEQGIRPGGAPEDQVVAAVRVVLAASLGDRRPIRPIPISPDSRRSARD